MRHALALAVMLTVALLLACEGPVGPQDEKGEPLLKATQSTSTIGGTKPGQPFIPGEIRLHRLLDQSSGSEPSRRRKLL